jgi:hypothetical protein
VLSFTPVQIWRYHAGRLADVSKQEPALVRRDLASLLAERRQLLARRDHRTLDLRGLLVALTADRLLLGDRAAAERALDADVDAGLAKNVSAGGPSGSRFSPVLLTLLGTLGY